MSSFLSEIKNILNEDQLILEPEALVSYAISPRDFFAAPIKAVLCPKSSEQISHILALCTKHKQPIIIQGGNTGLVGGQSGLSEASNIILSLKHFNKILDVNKYDFTAVVEAGVVLGDLHRRLEQENLMFPLQLASQDSCQIGGNLATNAGGLAVLSFGSMRDLCLGLEVVLADGSILHDLRLVKKDNMGYDLKNIFIGSEGTLGVITKASLKLFPKTQHKQLCYISFADIASILEFYRCAKQEFSQQLTSFELISDFAMDLSINYLRQSGFRRRKLQQKKAPWYVLLEISCAQDIGKLLQHSAVQDATIAHSLEDAAYFWHIRENLSSAQKASNVSIKNDISIPLINMAKFIEEAPLQIQKIVPEASIVCFGHIGDGNLHYNILAPNHMGKEFLNYWESITDIVNELVVEYGGSIAAEHGIGQLKRKNLQQYKDPVAYSLMQNLKNMLDPNKILNPEKILY